MKRINIFALVFLSVGVVGGSLYGEKETVLQEVREKYDAALSYSVRVTGGIDSEMTKTEDTAEQQAKEEGQRKSESALTEFKDEVTAVTRSAIARGKPLSSIDCIGKAALEGVNDVIPATLRKHLKAVDDVKTNKHQGLSFAKFEIVLVKEALEGLQRESLDKISQANSGFQNLKADAFRKAAAAEKQLHEIERRVPKPILFDEYAVLKNRIGKIYKEVKENLFRGLQKCIA